MYWEQNLLLLRAFERLLTRPLCLCPLTNTNFLEFYHFVCHNMCCVFMRFQQSWRLHINVLQLWQPAINAVLIRLCALVNITIVFLITVNLVIILPIALFCIRRVFSFKHFAQSYFFNSFVLFLPCSTPFCRKKGTRDWINNFYCDSLQQKVSKVLQYGVRLAFSNLNKSSTPPPFVVSVSKINELIEVEIDSVF